MKLLMSLYPKFLIGVIVALACVITTQQQIQACSRCTHCRSCTPVRLVEVEQDYVAMIPYAEVQERTITVNVPHIKHVQQNYTVKVPRAETRQTTKKIEKAIPETKMVKVSRDFGKWVHHFTPIRQEVCCDPPRQCNTCCSLRRKCARYRPTCCLSICTIDCPPQPLSPTWTPDVRTREIPVTTYRIISEEVPCEETVTVMVSEERTRTVPVVHFTTQEQKLTRTVTRYRKETRTRKICVEKPCCSCCDSASPN